jgi:hypothetical protein
MYLNGVQHVTYTGDIAVLSQTTLDIIWCMRTGNNYGYISELILADEDTRTLSLKTLAPDAAGTTNTFTGAYTAIDDVTLDYSDIIYSTANDQEFQANLTGMPTGDFTVRGVKVAIRAAAGAGGQDAQFGIRTNSTTYLSADLSLTSSWETEEVYYSTNPNTSARFTGSEIDALQLAVKSVA